MKQVAVRHARGTDIDLHGVVGIRLVNAPAGQAQAILARLGGNLRQLDREPDIEVHFTRRISAAGVCSVETGRSGYRGDEFIILGSGRRPVRLAFQFDSLNGTAHLQCEFTDGPVPLLDQLVRVLALRNGYAPLHASAFEYRGNGVVVAASGEGGKTSSVLAFAQRGARFIADDLVLLGEGGRRMLGTHTHIGLSDWQLDQLPGGRERMGRARSGMYAMTRQLERAQKLLGDRRTGRRLQRVVRGVRRRLEVTFPPSEIFRGPVADTTRLHTLFLAQSHDDPAIVVEPANPADVAKQLATSLLLQVRDCRDHYLAFRFAFPDRRCPVLDNLEARTVDLLTPALTGRDVFSVRLPRPVSLDLLYGAMYPCIRPPTRLQFSMDPRPAYSEAS